MFRYGDLIIYAAIIISVAYPFIGNKDIPNSRIQVICGDEIKYFDAKKDTIFQISDKNGSTVIEIKNNMVRIKESDCPDKYCVKHGWLDGKGNGKIICMPNKVIVKFIEENGNRIDAVTE